MEVELFAVVVSIGLAAVSAGFAGWANRVAGKAKDAAERSAKAAERSADADERAVQIAERSAEVARAERRREWLDQAMMQLTDAARLYAAATAALLDIDRIPASPERTAYVAQTRAASNAAWMDMGDAMQRALALSRTEPDLGALLEDLDSRMDPTRSEHLDSVRAVSAVAYGWIHDEEYVRAHADGGWWIERLPPMPDLEAALNVLFEQADSDE